MTIAILIVLILWMTGLTVIVKRCVMAIVNLDARWESQEEFFGDLLEKEKKRKNK